MLKSFARAAGFLTYLFITLEMLLMITPFAVYYYSVYSPVLDRSLRLPATAWMPAFFLPHLSTEIIPSIGGLIFLLGLIGFLLSAIQLYYAKFRRAGVVRGGLYKRIRHPQYLLLAVAGLGLLIVWPRFILLIVYIHMIWFYYLLARSEERRMQAQYGELYSEPMRRTPMFLPGEPGAQLARLLFGWIRSRWVRLFAIYALSLAVAVGAAFALRRFSLALTTHLSFADQKVAAVSLASGDGLRLRRLTQSAMADSEIQNRLNRPDDWVLVLVAEGKGKVVHVMIDAGMMRRRAQDLPLAVSGVKLVFLQRRDGAHTGPFNTEARWRPVLVAEMNGERISRVLALDQKLFLGNPVMPIF